MNHNECEASICEGRYRLRRHLYLSACQMAKVMLPLTESNPATACILALNPRNGPLMLIGLLGRAKVICMNNWAKTAKICWSTRPCLLFRHGLSNVHHGIPVSPEKEMQGNPCYAWKSHKCMEGKNAKLFIWMQLLKFPMCLRWKMDKKRHSSFWAKIEVQPSCKVLGTLQSPTVWKAVYSVNQLLYFNGRVLHLDNCMAWTSAQLMQIE